MGKFTDEFFEFPIKMYEGQKIYSDEDDIGEYTHKPWISGRVRVHKDDIISGGFYYQEWIGGKTIQDIREDGYEETAVWLSQYGEFICLWPYKKFEVKLNEFMARQTPQAKEEDLNL